MKLTKSMKIAVIGASNNENKFGYKIYKYLKNKGFEVFPVNPKEKEIQGDKCYKDLSDIPDKIDLVDTVVPSHITERIVMQCLELNIKNVWMQPGSSSNKAINLCIQNNIDVIHHACIMLQKI